MKSTYKLLGVQWDHGSLPEQYPEIIGDLIVPDWNEERNLFDLSCYVRQIPYTELMAAKDIEGVGLIIDHVRDCDKVYINVDYEPLNNSDIIIEFYALRLLQIYEYVNQQLGSVPVGLISSERIAKRCYQFLETRNRKQLTTK